MDIVCSPMKPEDYGRGSLEREVRDYIRSQGQASMLAFDGDACVGHVKEYRPHSRTASGLRGSRPWADFRAVEPLGLEPMAYPGVFPRRLTRVGQDLDRNSAPPIDGSLLARRPKSTGLAGATDDSRAGGLGPGARDVEMGRTGPGVSARVSDRQGGPGLGEMVLVGHSGGPNLPWRVVTLHQGRVFRTDCSASLTASRLFRNPSFVLLWSGQSVSYFGDAFFNLAVDVGGLVGDPVDASDGDHTGRLAHPRRHICSAGRGSRRPLGPQGYHGDHQCAAAAVVAAWS